MSQHYQTGWHSTPKSMLLLFLQMEMPYLSFLLLSLYSFFYIQFKHHLLQEAFSDPSEMSLFCTSITPSGIFYHGIYHVVHNVLCLWAWSSWEWVSWCPEPWPLSCQHLTSTWHMAMSGMTWKHLSKWLLIERREGLAKACQHLNTHQNDHEYKTKFPNLQST